MADASAADGNSAVSSAAATVLKDCSRFLFFSEQGSVLASNFPVEAAELKPLASLLDDRDSAIKGGLVVQGTRFEVHRHHPPLVYGRTMGGEPEESEGVALCKVDAGPEGAPCYGLITYKMPNISARMVPILQNFCKDNLQKA